MPSIAFFAQSFSLMRCLRWIGGALLFGIAGLALFWQCYVRSHIQEYKPDIERRLQKVLHLPMHIHSIHAEWYLVFPSLVADGVCIDTPQKLCAISASQLQLTMAWWNPWGAFGLDIIRPHAVLQRERDGRFSLAGIPLQSEHETDPEVLFEKLLEQRHITIQEGTLIWKDLTGRTRPLELKQLWAEFYNSWHRRRVRFSAQTSPAISSTLEGGFDFRPLGFHPKMNLIYGKGYLNLLRLDLSAWAPYVSELHNPIQHGLADLQFHFDIQTGRLRYLDTQLKLQDLEGVVDQEKVLLHQLDGHIGWSETGDADGGYHGTVTTKDLALKACKGCASLPINIDTHLYYHHALMIERAHTRIDSLDLPTISLLAQHIPLPKEWRLQLQQRFIEGTLENLEADWDRLKPPFWPTRFRAELRQVGWKSLEQHIPSIHGLNLSVRGTPEAGNVTLNGTHLRVIWPWLWSDFPVLSPATAELSWSTTPYIKFEVKQATLHTQDGMMTIKGNLSSGHPLHPGGWVQLEGKAHLQSAPRLMAYLPLTLPSGLLSWLTRGLKAGEGEMQWRVQGEPHHFPFLHGSLQEYLHFDIQAKQGVLQFASDWPDITGIQGRVVLHKNRIDIQAKQAQFGKLAIKPASVALVGIGTGAAELQAEGLAQGGIAHAMEVLRSSPVRSHIPSWIDQAGLDGILSSKLKLHFPIANPGAIQFDSESEGRSVGAHFLGLPVLSQASGRLHLSEKGFIETKVNGKLNGAPAEFTLTPQSDAGLHLLAKGVLTPEVISPWMDAKWRTYLKGQSDWSLDASIGSTRRFYRFHSSLKGLQSDLPSPLAKKEELLSPLDLELDRKGDTGVWWLRLPEQGIQARWVSSVASSAATHSELEPTLRGHIMLGQGRPQPSLPAVGWTVSGQLDGEHIPLAEWWKKKELFSGIPVFSGRSKPGVVLKWTLPTTPLRLDMLLVNMDAIHPLLNDSVLRWRSTADHLEMRFMSHVMNGNVYWKPQEKEGKVLVTMAHLNLPAANTGDASEPSKQALHLEAARPPIDLPPVAIDIEHFAYGNMNLGALKLKTETKGDTLIIPTLELINPESHFKADGSWNSHGVMHWNGEWVFENAGQFLKRVGVYDGLKNGSGHIKGSLQWQGLAPLANPKTLFGSVDVDFKNGQFIKVEPGIGKLLGLASLQALPKRLALDFRDVFSEGFLFNQIKGKMSFEQARFQTPENIMLEGDSANMTIHGYTDLIKETQEFDVRVLPNLSTGVAAATAFLVNPIVGGAAFFAQKVFKDPINKAFSYHYRVTGTWSDPVIQSAPAKAPLQPKQNGAD